MTTRLQNALSVFAMVCAVASAGCISIRGGDSGIESVVGADGKIHNYQCPGGPLEITGLGTARAEGGRIIRQGDHVVCADGQRPIER